MASAFSIKGEHPNKILRRLGTDYIVPGLLGQLLGLTLLLGQEHDADVPLAYGCVMLTLGTLAVLVGCYRQATYKRYSNALAALALLSLPGVLILYSLPRRSLERGRRGFEVVRPRKVSTLWVVDPEVNPARGGYRQFVRPHVLERASEITAQLQDE